MISSNERQIMDDKISFLSPLFISLLYHSFVYCQVKSDFLLHYLSCMIFHKLPLIPIEIVFFCFKHFIKIAYSQ